MQQLHATLNQRHDAHAQSNSPVVVKLATLQARLIGGEPAAVALHLSAENGRDQDAATVIARFRTALGPIDRASAEVMR